MRDAASSLHHRQHLCCTFAAHCKQEAVSPETKKRTKPDAFLDRASTSSRRIGSDSPLAYQARVRAQHLSVLKSATSLPRSQPRCIGPGLLLELCATRDFPLFSSLIESRLDSGARKRHRPSSRRESQALPYKEQQTKVNLHAGSSSVRKA